MKADGLGAGAGDVHVIRDAEGRLIEIYRADGIRTYVTPAEEPDDDEPGRV